MKEMQKIELLAPARNLECGIEAIKHGADAVYIGAARFGARAAAGNPIEDIAQLASFAHIFGAKVYVTVNTILNDAELPETEKMIWKLHDAGADAILVQDMGVLRMKLPDIALHASTQMDVRSVEKVRFLADCGFSRVVLARELSLEEIASIHSACPDVELECFVHGALCVSFSGQCYASECVFGRSANRGECAQFCRLPFTLSDADGNVAVAEKHLLSLRDMNRIDSVEELLDCGAVSLKIEGRLKDTSYVKNVTAAYSTRLDDIIRRRAEYSRSSSGRVRYTFSPDPSKSFNRGFTDYFLHGRKNDIWSFDTPKSIGSSVGYVGNGGPGWLSVRGDCTLNNGDGLCFFDSRGVLHGCHVNRVEKDIVYIFDGGKRQLHIPKNTRLFRNYDCQFEKQLAKESAVREIPIMISFCDSDEGFTVTMDDFEGNIAEVTLPFAHQRALKSQDENIKVQLSKLGTTVFSADGVRIDMSDNWFVPSSLLSDMRRLAVERLMETRERNRVRTQRKKEVESSSPLPEKITYLGNVMNSEAKSFYRTHGVLTVDDAYEKQHLPNVPVMFCRHCIKYAMGWCVRHGGVRTSFKEPYSIRMSDGREFRLEFDCRNCMMKVCN